MNEHAAAFQLPMFQGFGVLRSLLQSTLGGRAAPHAAGDASATSCKHAVMMELSLVGSNFFAPLWLLLSNQSSNKTFLHVQRTCKTNALIRHGHERNNQELAAGASSKPAALRASAGGKWQWDQGGVASNPCGPLLKELPLNPSIVSCMKSSGMELHDAPGSKGSLESDQSQFFFGLWWRLGVLAKQDLELVSCFT